MFCRHVSFPRRMLQKPTAFTIIAVIALYLLAKFSHLKYSFTQIDDSRILTVQAWSYKGVIPEQNHGGSSKYLTISDAPDSIRLCNRMFRLASAYGLARRSGRKILLRDLADESNLRLLSKVFDFGTSSNHPIQDGHILFASQLRNNRSIMWATLGEKWPCAYDTSLYEQLVGSLATHNVVISGYLQSYHYFQPYASAVRSLFTFQTDVRLAAERYLTTVRSSILQSASLITRHLSDVELESRPTEIILVGVHFRRGDLNTDDVRKRGYRLADMEYVYKAMHFFVTRLANESHVHVAFIVCSDSMRWFKSHFSIDELHRRLTFTQMMANLTNQVSSNRHAVSVHYSSQESERVHEKWSENVGLDFTVLALCNHSIMTVGSFGFWAAYLANGITVYYRRPFNPDTELAIEFNYRTTDYYPPEWIAFD